MFFERCLKDFPEIVLKLLQHLPAEVFWRISRWGFGMGEGGKVEDFGPRCFGGLLKCFKKHFHKIFKKSFENLPKYLHPVKTLAASTTSVSVKVV